MAVGPGLAMPPRQGFFANQDIAAARRDFVSGRRTSILSVRDPHSGKGGFMASISRRNLLASILVLPAAWCGADDGASLFNGHSLAGWKAGERHHSFRVEGGKIVAYGPAALGISHGSRNGKRHSGTRKTLAPASIPAYDRCLRVYLPECIGVEMEQAVRWNIKVSKETDLTLRTFLGARGMKKGDLSKFIEDAVRWRVFQRTVEDIKARHAAADPDEIQRIVNEAVGGVRAERRAQPKVKPDARGARYQDPRLRPHRSGRQTRRDL